MCPGTRTATVSVPQGPTAGGRTLLAGAPTLPTPVSSPSSGWRCRRRGPAGLTVARSLCRTLVSRPDEAQPRPSGLEGPRVCPAAVLRGPRTQAARRGGPGARVLHTPGSPCRPVGSCLSLAGSSVAVAGASGPGPEPLCCRLCPSFAGGFLRPRLLLSAVGNKARGNVGFRSEGPGEAAFTRAGPGPELQGWGWI